MIGFEEPVNSVAALGANDAEVEGRGHATIDFDVTLFKSNASKDEEANLKEAPVDR